MVQILWLFGNFLVMAEMEISKSLKSQRNIDPNLRKVANIQLTLHWQLRSCSHFYDLFIVMADKKTFQNPLRINKNAFQ